VDRATGEAEDVDPDAGKKQAAQELDRNGGRLRASKVTPERRAEIARKAAEKRLVRAI
jgi:general stress protein YciG